MTSLFLLFGGQILAGNLRNQFVNRIEFRNIKHQFSPVLFALLVNKLIYIYTFSLFPSINDIYRVSNNKHLYFKLLQATGKPVIQTIIEKKMLSKVIFTVLEF